VSFAGETGLEASALGSAGAVESSTYVTEAVEQPETFPAASVAVALKVVDVSLETETVRPGEAKAAAVPVAAAPPVQPAVGYTRTVEPASAEPVISGLLSLAGETGLEPSALGSAGAVESSTYVTEEVEQPETLPAASVTVALKVVDVSSDTGTVRPGEAKTAADPVAEAPPVQAAVG
jgi:hypothetical protein